MHLVSTVCLKDTPAMAVLKTDGKIYLVDNLMNSVTPANYTGSTAKISTFGSLTTCQQGYTNSLVVILPD